MEVGCLWCQQKYSYLGGGKEPRILPCGDSFCNQCIRQKCQIYQLQHLSEFQCIKCTAKIYCNQNFPLNKLYYEMQNSIGLLLKKREWESPAYSKEDDQLSRQHIRYDQKCLNPYCLRPKYQSEDIIELFCSKNCKITHQQLYND